MKSVKAVVLLGGPGFDTFRCEFSKANGADMSSLTVANPWRNSARKWNEFVGQDQISLVGALETYRVDSPALLPPELYRGWHLKSIVKPLTGHPLIDRQWQLVPVQKNHLSVRCKYRPTKLESQCDWSQ